MKKIIAGVDIPDSAMARAATDLTRRTQSVLMAVGVRFRNACSVSVRQCEIVQAYPREPGFKKKLIEIYARGIEHRPATTFGTVNADVLNRWDPDYRRLNFCGLVLGCDWPN